MQSEQAVVAGAGAFAGEHLERERAGDEPGAVEVVRQGGGPPLFLVADAGWAPRHAGALLAHLPADVPIVRVSTAAAAGFRTVRGLAAYLAREIRRVRSRGPYRLVGRAQAGALVYEVALQLVGADEEVEFLGVLDTSGPEDGPPRQSHAHGWRAEWPTRPLAANPGEGAAATTSGHEGHGAPAVDPSALVVHWCTGRSAAELPARHRWAEALRPHQLKVTPLACGPAPLSEAAEAEAHGRALALALRSLGGARRRTLPERGYAPLMTIQAGRHDTAPYFCVHGAGASVADFVPFAGAIGAAHPVHGFQARGMDGELAPYSSVEHAARVYLEEIEARYPRGGVHLVGHSFGGWIAFELAVRLQARGHAVRSLTVLDTEPPGGGGRLGNEYTRPEALMELIALHEQAAGKPIVLTRADFEGRPVEAQLRLLRDELVRVGLMPARSSPEHLRGTVRCFEAALATSYRPAAKFSGAVKLVLVRGQKESPAEADRRMRDVAERWGQFATRVDFRKEAGNHVTLLRAPHIGSVAGWMRAGTPPTEDAITRRSA